MAAAWVQRGSRLPSHVGAQDGRSRLVSVGSLRPRQEEQQQLQYLAIMLAALLFSRCFTSSLVGSYSGNIVLMKILTTALRITMSMRR